MLPTLNKIKTSFYTDPSDNFVRFIRHITVEITLNCAFCRFALILNRNRSYQTDNFCFVRTDFYLYDAVEPRSFELDRASNPTRRYCQHANQYPSVGPFQKSKLYHPLATILVAHHMHLFVAKTEYVHFSIGSYRLNSMNGALAPKIFDFSTENDYFWQNKKGVWNLLSLYTMFEGLKPEGFGGAEGWNAFFTLPNLLKAKTPSQPLINFIIFNPFQFFLTLFKSVYAKIFNSYAIKYHYWITIEFKIQNMSIYCFVWTCYNPTLYTNLIGGSLFTKLSPI